jgi:hypothetical protein
MPKLKGLRSMLSRPSASGRLIPSIECRKVAGCVRLRNSVDDPELNQLLRSVHVIAAKHTRLSYRSWLNPVFRPIATRTRPRTRSSSSFFANSVRSRPNARNAGVLTSFLSPSCWDSASLYVSCCRFLQFRPQENKKRQGERCSIKRDIKLGNIPVKFFSLQAFGTGHNIAHYEERLSHCGFLRGSTS